MARFGRTYRRAIEELAGSSPRLEDLVETFPGLLFALATGYGAPEQRAIALLLIRNGAQLRAAAGIIGLPWWLRRLAPECYEAPLGEVPSSPDFTRRITNLVPADSLEAPGWLGRVLFAHRAAGEEYALWMARHRRFPPGPAGEISETLLAAWAWHSQCAQAPAHALLRGHWSEASSLKRALQEAKVWSLRIDLAASIGAGIADSWYQPGGACGYDFVPLRTLHDFLAEAAAMGNCLDQYGDQVRHGRTRIFSIRRAGRPVADVEIGAHEDDCAIPRIEQLRGARNRRAGPEIWQAAYAWLSAQAYRPLPRGSGSSDRGQRQNLIRALWRPYLEAVKGSPIDKRVQALVFGKEITRSFPAFQNLAPDDEPTERQPAFLTGEHS